MDFFTICLLITAGILILIGLMIFIFPKTACFFFKRCRNVDKSREKYLRLMGIVPILYAIADLIICYMRYIMF